MQLSVQQQLSGLPTFPAAWIGLHAYAEVVRFYANTWHGGRFFQDPFPDYGRLPPNFFRGGSCWLWIPAIPLERLDRSRWWSSSQVVSAVTSLLSFGPTAYIAWPAQSLLVTAWPLKLRSCASARGRWASIRYYARFTIIGQW